MKRHAKSLQAKAKKVELIAVRKDSYLVKSTSGQEYTIFDHSDGTFTCTCKWAEFHNTRVQPCAHVLGLMEALENLTEDQKLSFWETEEDAKRQHRPVVRVGLGLYATSRKS